MIQFKENAQTDGRKDRRTDRPYSIGPFRLQLGVQLMKMAELMPIEDKSKAFSLFFALQILSVFML